MTDPIADLNEEQQEKLQLFKTAVDDILRPEHDDYYLLRWLKARNFDAVLAEKMIRTSLNWRIQIAADSLIDEYEPSAVLKNYYPGGLVGHDREGCPVWILPLGDLDIKGLFYSVKKTEIVRYTVRMLELSEEDMKRKSEQLGRLVDKHVFILDMDNFSMKQVAWKPAVDMITQLVTLFEDNYPERLKKIFVVNAPKYFPVAYALVKPFLADETAKKIEVFGKGTWREKLHEMINPYELPVHWGGTKVDPVDGDLRCPSVVCCGGQVPCSYYTTPSRRLSIDQNLESVVVDKKSFHIIQLNVEIARSMIRWEFKTENYDIAFCVYRQRTIEELEGPNSGDDEDIVVPYQRVNCHLVPEDGLVVVEKPGKYCVKFDNSYSWYRSKRVLYSITLIPPTVEPKKHFSEDMFENVTSIQ